MPRRLDYFLISFSLYTQIDQCDISPHFKTDHSSVDVRDAPLDFKGGEQEVFVKKKT